MQQEAPPAKPPRGSTSGAGGAVPGTSEERRKLWQIFWNEEEDEPVVSTVDISNIEEEEINTGSDGLVKVRQQNGEVVLFEKRNKDGTAAQSNGNIYNKKGFREKDWESFDVTPQTRSSGRVLLRSESDADLMLPSTTSRTQKLSVSLRWCCINCRHFAFWRQYWWVPLVIVLLVVIYVVVILVIIKTMAD